MMKLHYHQQMIESRSKSFNVVLTKAIDQFEQFAQKDSEDAKVWKQTIDQLKSLSLY